MVPNFWPVGNGNGNGYGYGYGYGSGSGYGTINNSQRRRA